jgi:hypothetical protein
MNMRSSTLIVLALLTTTSAMAAEEPSGCDKFKWNIDHARAALTAKLPTPPERAPKDGTFAGFTKFTSASKAGSYTISLSAGAWIDVVQDGHFLKPTAFSGATDCDGIRKTVKIDLSATPFVLQISGARENSISLVVQPSE